MSDQEPHRKALLLVDDSPDDVFLLTWALKKRGSMPSAHFAANGVEAVDYLRACLDHQMPWDHLPTLVLLDIKMPKVNGLEALQWIRAQPALDHLPVYMLSSSALESDMSKAKEARADGYWVKPSRLQDYLPLADRIQNLLFDPQPSATSSDILTSRSNSFT
jgi:CheY-like chemotaxis protein